LSICCSNFSIVSLGATGIATMTTLGFCPFNQFMQAKTVAPVAMPSSTKIIVLSSIS
jgi:hypothetical protein